MGADIGPIFGKWQPTSRGGSSAFSCEMNQAADRFMAVWRNFRAIRTGATSSSSMSTFMATTVPDLARATRLDGRLS